MNKNWKRILLYLVFIVISASGDALAFKGDIGVNPWEAVSQALNYITLVKIGTLTIILNIAMVLIEMLLRKKFDPLMILQVAVSFLIGFVVNFIVYTFLGGLVLDSYASKLIITVLGFIISATGNGLMMTCSIAAFPLEGMCQALAEKTGKDFAKTRQLFDVLFVALSLLIAFVFECGLSVREGTVISMVIYSPIMGFVLKKAQPKIDRLLKE